MRQKLVLIGNGMAGVRVLEELLERAPDRYDVTVFGAEPHPTYNRIMLSPVLAGEKSFEDIVTHNRAWYAENGFDLRAGLCIDAIDRGARDVVAADGIRFPFDRLVIATGSHPFVIPVPGRDLPGVITFRDIADVDAMVAAAGNGRRAVVIGGGLLGLEAANGLLARGMTVTVVHLMATVMERQLDDAAGHLLRRELERRGLHRGQHRVHLRRQPCRRRAPEGRTRDPGRPGGDGGRHQAQLRSRQGGGSRRQSRPGRR